MGRFMKRVHKNDISNLPTKKHPSMGAKIAFISIIVSTVEEEWKMRRYSQTTTSWLSYGVFTCNSGISIELSKESIEVLL